MIISTNKLFATLVSATCFCALPALAQTAELPRTYIDTTYAPGPGASIYVAAGGDLQSAFNRAQPGDSILLEPGATFTGNFELPAKLGNSWIYIQTAPTPALPPVDTRITPSASPSLPKIVSPNNMPAIAAGPGAHHYRLVGLEITTIAPYGYSVVHFDGGPHHMVVDRCYIHGGPTQSIRRGILGNADYFAAINNYISEIHGRGEEAQAIAIWDNTGPIKIVNNFLSGAGENVMFGGAIGPRPVVPSDIEIRGNHFFKALEWT